ASSQYQRLVEEGVEFGGVLVEQACGGGRVFRTPDVARPCRFAGFARRRMNVRRDKRPGALVLRLFLAPDGLRVRKTLQFPRQRIFRERIELFDAQKLDAIEAPLLPLLEEIVVDLARTENHARDVA